MAYRHDEAEIAQRKRIIQTVFERQLELVRGQARQMERHLQVRRHTGLLRIVGIASVATAAVETSTRGGCCREVIAHDAHERPWTTGTTADTVARIQRQRRWSC